MDVVQPHVVCKHSMTRIAIILLGVSLLYCAGHDDKVIARWDDNSVKSKHVFYNDRDTTQYLLLTYYRNGQPNERIQFFGKQKNGWTIAFYDNGEVKDSTFFRNNIPMTTTRHYYRNGNPAYVGQFDEYGNSDSKWSYFDSLGRLSSVTEFEGSNVKIKTTYFDTLGWMTKEILFKDGAIDEEKNYKDSLQHGRYLKYHPAGTVAKSGEFINGKTENTRWTDFYDSGQKYREYTFIGEHEWSTKIDNMWDKAGNQSVKEGQARDT
jgi:antitoxin component YwqK of YwqJK toxin-antitoxin module